MYVAIDTNEGNDSYLDIYLEGSAEGWVGVGFGHSQDMVRRELNIQGSVVKIASYILKKL